MNSCLLLGLSLYTGVDLSAAFKDEDLVGTGIERDSHITVFYTPSQEVPVTDMTGKIRTILGEKDYEDLLHRLKSQEPLKVLDHFSLGKFENDHDFLVLHLQPESDLYDTLQILNTGLVRYYGIKQSFPEYKPHMTLAELESGKAKNYMFSGVLGMILEKATFTLDDFIFSQGYQEEGYKTYQITTENAVSRYFRQLHLQEDKDYYDSL